MNIIGYQKMKNKDLESLKKEYEKLFEADLEDPVNSNGSTKEGLESQWIIWKKVNVPQGLIPETIRELLVMDYEHLVDVYERFRSLNIQTTIGRSRNQTLVDLDNIFKYKNGYDSKIAQFFMDHASSLEIHTCYYCEMAYVNTYEIEVKGGKDKRRQFDLDHFLPKSVCPCVGLSLFNFVPSCQVCNSRIKGDDLPAVDAEALKVLSPSSMCADFDANMAIRLRPTIKNGKLSRDGYVYFRTREPYDDYTTFFHLQERYDFHRTEAQRLLGLVTKYPDSNIRKIAKLLRRTSVSIKEDIYNEKFLEQEGRCFAKMTHDILNPRSI